MSIHEIVLPETKPETEWVRGRALKKTGGTYTHGALQLELGSLLRVWAANGHGRVGSEWRFRVAPPGKVVRPLVPDLAYLSYDALPEDAPDEAVAAPLCSPTVAIEILSPDRRPDVEDKIATYLAAGTAAVMVVDPRRRTIAVHDAVGASVLEKDDVLCLTAMPGFAVSVEEVFRRAKR
ncbi:MAG TPA: Uma2 family endonuclease [Candidatus Limnocylindrales bacterium]|nr:Uma2 family endonuclease [Candidatus Limnocylindrales bacterium]